MDDDLDSSSDMCRVCRCEGSSDKPLYHPCICTGSIKFIHQDCLVQWLRYSEKDYCEVCNHKFSFIPIYSPDMPKHLPFRDLLAAFFKCLGAAARCVLQYTLVVLAWLIIIPLTSYRVYMVLFNFNLNNLTAFSIDFYKSDNLLMDIFYGFCVISTTVCIFIFLLWLREQMLRVGTPDWVENPQYLQKLQRLLQFVGISITLRQEDAQAEQQQTDDVVVPEYNDDANIEDNDDEEISDDDGFDMSSDDTDNSDVEDELNNNDDQEQRNQVQAVDANAAGGQEGDALGDWNAVIDWDRGPENLTWRKIIGLDGTFAFLENVFWLITFNTLSLVAFSYFPFHTGNVVLKRMGAGTLVSHQFDRFISIFIGYMVISVLLLKIHFVLSIFSPQGFFKRVRKMVGISYIVVKVALLIMLEILVFPTLVGCCLDVCSLPLFGIKLDSRIQTFFTLPASSLFIHWLSGMVCVFYFISFLFIVKDAVRPGVLWFIRNLHDPNFNPVGEMIHLSVFEHLLRCANSLVAFAIIIFFLVYLPICCIQLVIPEFLSTTYTTISNKSIFSYVSVFDLMIMVSMIKAVFPGFADHHNHQAQDFARGAVKLWLGSVSYLLDLKSYLLGNEEAERNDDQYQAVAAANVYHQPNYFKLRVTLMVGLFALTIFLFGLFCLTIPIFIGYLVLCSLKENVLEIPINILSTIYFGFLALIELYYIRVGRVVEMAREPFNNVSLNTIFFRSFLVAGRLLTVLLLTFFVAIIPFLIGTLFDLIVLLPMRVPLNQTPILYFVQDWVIGCFLLNVICPMIMMTNWRLRQELEILQDMDLRNINITLILYQLVLPAISYLGLILLLPFLACKTVLPYTSLEQETRYFIVRRIHLFLFTIAMTVFVIVHQFRRVASLYEHIRNDKYLVGRRLVNYESAGQSSSSSEPDVASSSH